MKTESIVMNLCKRAGLNKMAWALRRLHCPVTRDALVLEVGSGGNPYPRANVLLDAYKNTEERHYVPLKADRPLILGFGERLPFRDKVFDFAIACHVLEHSADPAKFLSELQRVARAGYIEVPDAFMERINPYRFHRLEITESLSKLIIRKKSNWIVDEDLVKLYERKSKEYIISRCFSAAPELFHVRYYWHDKIEFTILNPEIDCGWVLPKAKDGVLVLRRTIRDYLIDLVRIIFSQNKRNRGLDILGLLECPICGGVKFSKEGENTICSKCRRRFSTNDNIITMNESQKR